jgi:hypothetical protein
MNTILNFMQTWESKSAMYKNLLVTFKRTKERFAKQNIFQVFK